MQWPTDDRLAAFLATLTSGVTPPALYAVERVADPPPSIDVDETVDDELRRIVAPATGAGQELCIAVGSRGIAELARIVSAAVDTVRRLGYTPVIVPAMGSHGGATAEGQAAILADYGITEWTTGAEVRADMATEVIGHVDGTIPVHVARTVLDAGRALLVARVKPHTDLRGPIQSGLAKMAAIGLGKQAGAQAIHRHGMDGLERLMPEIGRRIAARYLVGGLAVVEDAHGALAELRGVPASAVGGAEEVRLLEQARRLMGRLPVADIDVLVVERMGKQVSGTGMDPNVIGRSGIEGVERFADVTIGALVVLSLTPESHGNAAGIGLADIAPRRLLEHVDLADLYCNALTAGRNGLGRAKLPVTVPTDRDAVTAAMATCGRADDDLGVVWIEDTLRPERALVSAPVWRALREGSAAPATRPSERPPREPYARPPGEPSTGLSPDGSDPPSDTPSYGAAVSPAERWWTSDHAVAMPFDADGQLAPFHTAYAAAGGAPS